MAGAIVGLVIASNEITKENHTTEGTLVSKDKGDAVRLRLRHCVQRIELFWTSHPFHLDFNRAVASAYQRERAPSS